VEVFEGELGTDAQFFSASRTSKRNQTVAQKPPHILDGRPTHAGPRRGPGQRDAGLYERQSPAPLDAYPTFWGPFSIIGGEPEPQLVAIAHDDRDGEVRYLGEIDNSPDAVRKLVPS
jgi:hypothetical protein